MAFGPLATLPRIDQIGEELDFHIRGLSQTLARFIRVAFTRIYGIMGGVFLGITIVTTLPLVTAVDGLVTT